MLVFRAFPVRLGRSSKRGESEFSTHLEIVESGGHHGDDALAGSGTATGSVLVRSSMVEGEVSTHHGPRVQAQKGSLRSPRQWNVLGEEM